MSLCAMLAMAGSTFADDTFSVDPVTLPINAQADLVVRFSFAEACPGYTFDLKLPAELEFVTDTSGDVTCTLGDCYPTGSSITTNIEGGKLHVAWLHTGGKTLTEQSGILVSFKVKVKNGATVAVGQTFEGNSGGTLTDGTVSNNGGQVHNVADSQFTITIAEAIDLHTILDELSTDVPAATTKPVDVRVKRTINANQWSTICLPFAMTEEQVTAAFGTDVEVLDFNDYTTGDDKIIVNFVPVTAISANHPYVIKVSTPIDYENGFTVDGVIVDPSDELEINFGTNRKPRAIVGTYEANTTVPELCLFLSNNEFWYSLGYTKMKAFRAYFDFYDILSEVDDEYGAPVFFNIGGETTRLDQLNIDNDDDNYYTLDGRAVKTPGKGVYIHRGKKIIIK